MKFFILREVAEELHISKETARRHYHHIDATQRHKVGRSLAVDEEGLALIQQAIQADYATPQSPQPPHHTTPHATIECGEIDSARIKFLENQIIELTRLLDQQQKLTAQATQKIELLEAPKKRWWRR